MARFDYNCDTLWLKHLREGESDLLGEALLYLETASKHFGDTSELGQTDYATVRDVADMHLAHKGNQMVLAKGEDLDVPHDDELVMVLVEDSTVDDVAQVLFVTLCEEEQRFRVALWCVEQPLTVGVFAQTLEHSPDSARQLLEVRHLLLFGCLLPLPRTLAGPAKPVEVDGGVLRVRAVGPAGREWCLRNGTLERILSVYLTIRHDMAVVSVHVRDGRLRGEVASRPVKIYWLAASVGRLYSMKEVFSLLLVARLGGKSEGGSAVHHMRGDRGLGLGRVGIHDGGESGWTFNFFVGKEFVLGGGG